MSRQKDYGKPIFHEETHWGFGIWSFIAFLYLTLVIALLVSIDTSATIIAMAPITLFIYYLWKKSISSITVTKGWFIVGNAGIERAYISKAIALSAAELRQEAGQDFNPDAYVQLRAWLKKGVKVILRDPQDPTPYWLIACKNNELLAKALNTPEGL